MKILHLVSDRRRRGAQVHAAQLLRALESLGVHGDLLAVDPTPVEGGLDAEALPRSRRDRRRVAMDHDLVVAHGSTTLDAAATSVPGRFLYRSIGDPAYWLDRPTRRAKAAVLYRCAVGIVALYPCAAADISRLTGVDRSRIHVIPNAVAGPPSKSPARPVASTVLVVGSLSPEKRVDHVIRAVAPLDRVELTVVGDGPLRADLERLGSELMPGRVRFVGTVDDPGPWYREASVLALASLTEGIPAVALEAALHSVPTCAYDVGGVSTVVRHATTGHLAATGDVAGLRDALVATLARSAELGAAARTNVEQYSVDAIAHQWVHLFSATLRRIEAKPSSNPLDHEPGRRSHVRPLVTDHNGSPP